MCYKFKVCKQCYRPIIYLDCDNCVKRSYDRNLYKYSKNSYKFLLKRAKNIKKFQKFSFRGDHDEWLYRKY